VQSLSSQDPCGAIERCIGAVRLVRGKKSNDTKRILRRQRCCSGVISRKSRLSNLNLNSRLINAAEHRAIVATCKRVAEGGVLTVPNASYPSKYHPARSRETSVRNEVEVRCPRRQWETLATCQALAPPTSLRFSFALTLLSRKHDAAALQQPCFRPYKTRLRLMQGRGTCLRSG